MPAGYKLRGIAPYELRNYPDAVKLMYWGIVVDLGIKAKDRDLAQGLDAHGEPLRAIATATRRHRKSAMTPDGRGDPSAPPLMPGRKLSRTRSLLAGRAFTTHAEFYWRFDPWTHDTWAKILTYHKEKGRDVFGLSEESTDMVRRQALAKWMAWKRAGAVVPLELEGRRVLGLTSPTSPPAKIPQAGRMNTTYATFGINAPPASSLVPGRWSGGFTEAELKAHFRAPVPVSIPGRPEGTYNRILSHIWGHPGQATSAGGAVVPLTPPRPKLAALKPRVEAANPKVPEKAARKPVANPPVPEPMTIGRFAAAAQRAAGAVPEALRYGETRAWISDAYGRFYALHPEISYGEFKRRLIEANMARLVTLARNDMPHAVPAADFPKIALSETFQGDAVFHWIRL